MVLLLIFLFPSFNDAFVHPHAAGKTVAQPSELPPPGAKTGNPEHQFEDFLGSEACRQCHAAEYKSWKESTHGNAGGSPSEVAILGKFDGKPRQFKEATVQPVKRGDRYSFYLRADGIAEEHFQVDAVVGGGHMIGGGTQTYFSEFPDGTLRFLPFDFIRDEQQWFGETHDQQGWIPISSELGIDQLSEWPPSRILGTHLSRDNCQECHGSQIQVRYDPTQRRYETKYKSLTINCESCHGPGKKHVEIARSGAIDTVPDIGMRALATLTKDESLDVCFRCHALKDALQTGFLPGNNLEDYYALKFPVLDGNIYHNDSRIKAFGYQLNHLSSDCYLNGSMTCVDCHDPHAQTYRDVTGRPLADPFDDGQCTSCHPSKAVDVTKHTFHPVGSTGSKCVSCHMPYLQHPAIGDQLRFARSDHTIAIPRPAYDAAQGLESACRQCHPDKTVEALAAQTREWYGDLKPHPEVVANLNKAAEATDRFTAGNLLLNPEAFHPIGQMQGLSRFANQYLSADMQGLEPELVDKIKGFCDNLDKDLQALALASLHLAQGNQPEIKNYLAQKLENLGSDEMAVRRRWAMALPRFAGTLKKQGQWQKAIETYHKALEVLPQDPAALLNLGHAYQTVEQYDLAEHYYREALKADPYNAGGWINLGNVHQLRGDEATAYLVYQKAVQANPWNATAHFNIGNHHYRNNALPEAILSYRRAISVDPALSEAHFNLTRALIKAGKYADALRAVKAGLKFDPSNATGIQMLADLTAALSQGK